MRVRQTTPKIRQIAGVKFLPGINYLDGEKWETVKKHNVGKEWIKKGFLVEVPEEKAERTDQTNESKHDEPTARELVNDMPDLYDMDKLKKLAEDDRKTVADAAKRQIDKINSMAKEDSE